MHNQLCQARKMFCQARKMSCQICYLKYVIWDNYWLKIWILGTWVSWRFDRSSRRRRGIWRTRLLLHTRTWWTRKLLKWHNIWNRSWNLWWLLHLLWSKRRVQVGWRYRISRGRPRTVSSKSNSKLRQSNNDHWCYSIHSCFRTLNWLDHPTDFERYSNNEVWKYSLLESMVDFLDWVFGYLPDTRKPVHPSISYWQPRSQVCFLVLCERRVVLFLRNPVRCMDLFPLGSNCG